MKEKIEFENVSFERENINKKQNIIQKFFIGLFFIIIIIVIIIVMINRKKIDNEVYEAIKSEYEIYCESKAYIINNEEVVNYDKNSTIITLAEASKRIAVNDVIALYKTSEYDNNQEKIKSLDEQINNKLESLSVTYSNEIVQVENEINDIIQEIKNTSSYIKINEYKSKLDQLAYKKAKIAASLNPSGTEVLSLISEREAFKENTNNSLSNIKAPISGVVIYKLDGLENKFDAENLDITKIKEIKKSYDNKQEEILGIKIVDNFESYIIVKEDISKQGYMKEGYNYIVELLEKDTSLKAQLVKIITSDEEDEVYCVLRMTNGIENIVDLRTTDVKVIWKQYTGFWVNNTSITKEGDISYVTILSLNKHIKIPVKIIAENENNTLVQNYTKAEIEQLGIERERSLILYDRILKDVILEAK